MKQSTSTIDIVSASLKQCTSTIDIEPASLEICGLPPSKIIVDLILRFANDPHKVMLSWFVPTLKFYFIRCYELYHKFQVAIVQEATMEKTWTLSFIDNSWTLAQL
jgi:hypothetical protein